MMWIGELLPKIVQPKVDVRGGEGGESWIARVCFCVAKNHSFCMISSLRSQEND